MTTTPATTAPAGCARCNGTGTIDFYVGRIDNGRCFACNGTGDAAGWRARRKAAKAQQDAIHMGQITCRHCGAQGVVPIPEGTRVGIEYPCDVCLGHGRRWRNGRPDGVRCSCDNGMVPVAFATLTEVSQGDDGYLVTLTNLLPVEEVPS